MSIDENILENPLLSQQELPPFSEIQAQHVVPGMTQLLDESREHLACVLKNIDAPTWESLVEPLEAQDDLLGQSWSPVSHLHAVLNTPELRDAYRQSVSLLTQYSTEVSQNKALFDAYDKLAKSSHYATLSTSQKKVIDNELQSFKLGGVELSGEKKKRYGDISQKLSALSTQFSNNVLDATQNWYKKFDVADALIGLPESALEQAKQAGDNKKDEHDEPLGGYVITLDFPSYLAVMMYADNRSLREEVYRAYVTRASILGVKSDGTSAKEWDNSKIISEILTLKHEQAKLLGFNNSAEKSLAKKMAETPDEVIGFLTELSEKSKSFAEKDIEELTEFAKEGGLENISAWDLVYFSEKLRQEKYAISQEVLKPYFPASKVISGMFTVVERLFGITLIEIVDFDTYHQDVQFFHVKRNKKVIAKFYLDLYAREDKRGGAWMADCRSRRNAKQGLQLPVAFLTCNFTPPRGDDPALLTHDEVTTLFHEFGHGLHHMLTTINEAGVSGINGVPWDAVELPSQFMENWCWQEEVIPLISGHYKTGEVLPKALLEKMLLAKNFQSGMQMMRQLEFALFDMRLHAEFSESKEFTVKETLNEIREKYAVFKTPDFNCFENSFSHIFSGGYAAGYYSYKWAEVLSADAFSAFEEEGIFNQATGERFLQEILEKGGSSDPMSLFKKFRGHKPSIEPLLRHGGLVDLKHGV